MKLIAKLLKETESRRNDAEVWTGVTVDSQLMKNKLWTTSTAQGPTRAWLTDTGGFLFRAPPLMSGAGLHCQSNHVFFLANPFKAYMSHHHRLHEWNYTMTKLFSLGHKAAWFGNIRREERKGCGGESFDTAFVAAYESSHSVSWPNELVWLV